MAKYKKKPIAIEAFLFGVDPMPEWAMNNENIEFVQLPFNPITPDRDRSKLAVIKTWEGNLIAHEGEHYIIQGVQGEVYPCEKYIFEQTYEPYEPNED